MSSVSSSRTTCIFFEEKPDVVVCLGDWFDMASLSSHDKGKKSFEGRRYKQDVAVGVDAFEKTWAPTFKWNKQRSKNHKAQYNPERIFLYGNHEARLDKTVQLQSELEGAISYDDYQVWPLIVLHNVVDNASKD